LSVFETDLDLYRAWFWNGSGAADAVPAATAAAATAAVVAHAAAATTIFHRNSKEPVAQRHESFLGQHFRHLDQSRSGIISGGGSFGRS
jgi:hypothetical protein